MSGTPLNPKVDDYIRRSTRWQAEMTKLRAILLTFPLMEELKWGVPTYTLEGSNVVLMHEFKDYCALLFVKGVLLQDPKSILIQQTQNVQAGRHVRFTDLDQVEELEPVLKVYIQHAIDVEKAGLKVEYKKTVEFDMPEEFRKKLEESPALKTAFEKLTPGRQRAYLLYFFAPKQSQTRASRVEKCTPQIFEGKGLND